MNPEKSVEQILQEESEKAAARRGDPRQNLARSEIRKSRAAEAAKHEPFYEHNEAFKNFHFGYGDILRDPLKAQELLSERQQLIDKAIQKKEPINWKEAYPKLGERIRAKYKAQK